MPVKNKCLMNTPPYMLLSDTRNNSTRTLQNCVYGCCNVNKVIRLEEQLSELIIKQEEQRKLLLHLLERQEEEEVLRQRITLNNQEETVCISLRDLIRIESRGNCCTIYAAGYPNAICVSINIGKYIEPLKHLPFLFRTHRRHFVNLHYAKKIIKKDGSKLIVKAHNGDRDVEIEVAQRYREALLKRLLELPVL